jgi:drug/metabolite transporter (DMT)-like permease
MSEQHHTRAVLIALFVTVLWSSSWVIIRIGLDDEGLSPITFAGLRYSMAAVILMMLTATRPTARRAMRSLSRRDLGLLVGLGLVLYTLTQGSQFVALDNQPAATTSLVLSMTPLVVAAMSKRSLDEAATAPQVVGAVLVLAGAGLYFSGALGATVVGLTAAIVGLLSNSGGSLLGRAANRALSTDPLVVTTVSMSVGAAVLVVAGLVSEGLPTVTGTGLVIIVWLALVNTAWAFTLWNQSLRHLTATESAVINNTMLIQIALLAWWFLDESPSLIQAVGIGVVTVGIITSQRR